MKIQPFQIRREINGSEIILHPTLLTVNNRHYLIDCGYEETFQALVAKLRLLGVAPGELHAVLISHDDIDHLGGLALLKDVCPRLLVYSSETEAPSIAGRIKSERLEQAERSLADLPEEHHPWALQFIESLKNIRRVPVDSVLRHGDFIEGEVEVIATPGHTKGHISFWIPSKKTLIANDALVIENGQFDIANPMFTLDMPRALQSVAVIQSLQPERIICYHGGVAKDDIPSRLSALLSKY